MDGRLAFLNTDSGGQTRVLYGMPVVCPKISNIDIQRMIICVVNTKGSQDCDLPLSQAMLETLRAY